MNNYELAKLITQSIVLKEKQMQNKQFYITNDTVKKVLSISSIITKYNPHIEKTCHFDTTFNALDITLQCYVFQGTKELLTTIAENTDLFSIDSIDDGKLCIELRLLNVAEIV